MISEEEIIIMTKLAIYDKKYGEQDKKANELYFKDYVYRKNFYARLLAFIGCIIVMLLYITYIILSDDLHNFLINYKQYALIMFIFIACVMIFYTFINTKIVTKDYKNIKNRLKSYFILIKELDKLKDNE